MIVKLYVVFDKVAAEAGPVFQAKNDGVALRQYNELLVKNQVKNTEEYQLLCLGQYDTEKPSVVSFPTTEVYLTVDDNDE